MLHLGRRQRLVSFVFLFVSLVIGLLSVRDRLAHLQRDIHGGAGLTMARRWFFNGMICAAALLICGATPALAGRIDFEVVPTGSLGRTITIDGVTFESPVELFVGEYFTDTETTRALCSRTPGNFGCESNLSISFASPASRLTLLVDGANSDRARILAFATLFDGSSTTLVFDGFQERTPRTLEFGTLENIQSVMFSTDDPKGFSYDDFSSSAGAVPEPTTWAMLICGFGFVGSALRSRRNASRLMLVGRSSCAV